MRFHRDAAVEILDRSGYPNRAAFAREIGMSPGALHDILVGDPPRRTPSNELIHRIARGLKIPVTAILADPTERVA